MAGPRIEGRQPGPDPGPAFPSPFILSLSKDCNRLKALGLLVGYNFQAPVYVVELVP